MIKKTTITKKSDVPAEQIVAVFDVFYKTINPVINFQNETQRKAARILIKKFGPEKAVRAAEYAVKHQGQRFCPTITTPHQLKEKLGDLLVYYYRENPQALHTNKNKVKSYD